MKLHHLIQGAPEWKAYRAQHRNASDAPAMMGCSPYKTRQQLLREVHTGVAVDVDVGTQKRFDNGHRLEALARPLAEEFVGQELYPVTGSLGSLSASFDGLTMDESIALEHKDLNDDLRAIFKAGTDDIDGSLLPLMHRVQMEQQLLVSGAERVLFMTSDWTADGELVEEHHCWYYPDAALRQQIVDGWAQFERDLATYVLPEAVEPAPVGKAPDTLPALRIEITGAVTASNLDAFKQTALAAIRSVNRDLKTDSDFADADKAVKWCADVESRIAAAKEHALSQTATIDALFKTLDDIAAESKRVRLDLSKLSERRKVERKEEAVFAARKLLDAHIADLNGELAPMLLQPAPVDFAGAIKGLRSFASMDDALQTAVAAGKIAADAAARVIRANLFAFKAKAAGYEFLFSDLSGLVHKGESDFCAQVDARISAHKAAEAAKEAKRAEAEQARIAAEAKRLADQHIEDARVAALVARREMEVAAESARVAAQAAIVTPRPAIVSPPPPVAPPVAQFVSPPAPDEPATLILGTICGRLGFTVSAAFLADVLHIQPARTDRAAKLYTEGQFGLICRQIAAHVSLMAEMHAGEMA